MVTGVNTKTEEVRGGRIHKTSEGKINVENGEKTPVGMMLKPREDKCAKYRLEVRTDNCMQCIRRKECLPLSGSS